MQTAKRGLTLIDKTCPKRPPAEAPALNAPGTNASFAESRLICSIIVRYFAVCREASISASMERALWTSVSEWRVIRPCRGQPVKLRRGYNHGHRCGSLQERGSAPMRS
jgi:hypothetical protein